MYYWFSWGRGFDPPVRQHSFVEMGYEITYTAILSLALIQVGQLLAKGCAHNTGQLFRSKSVQKKCCSRLTDCLNITLVVHWDVK